MSSAAVVNLFHFFDTYLKYRERELKKVEGSKKEREGKRGRGRLKEEGGWERKRMKTGGEGMIDTTSWA